MAHVSTRRLDSGMHAELRHEFGGTTLTIDGTPQSHVRDDETSLLFEYIQHMGYVIDALAPEKQGITAIHLGAGAFTLARYVAATRPGSRQQVIEIDRSLVDFVRDELPLPRGANIRFRYGDARDVLERMPAGIVGTADLVVVDIFAGARTPAHVTSDAFYEVVRRMMAPTGVALVNVADGDALTFARSQAATLRHVFQHVAIISTPSVLKHKVFGNLVMVASDSELPLESIPRMLAMGYPPARLLTGGDVAAFAQNGVIVTDLTATGSPEPTKNIFTKRGNRS